MFFFLLKIPSLHKSTNAFQLRGISWAVSVTCFNDHWPRTHLYINKRCMENICKIWLSVFFQSLPRWSNLNRIGEKTKIEPRKIPNELEQSSNTNNACRFIVVYLLLKLRNLVFYFFGFQISKVEREFHDANTSRSKYTEKNIAWRLHPFICTMKFVPTPMTRTVCTNAGRIMSWKPG